MKDQLKKAIALSKKTGDRLMVYDISESHDPYIVMAIDDYEKIVLGDDKDGFEDLTDTQLTDKINRDIAVWKDNQVIEKEENFKHKSDTKNEGGDDNDNNEDEEEAEEEDEPIYEQFGVKKRVSRIDTDEEEEPSDDKPQRGWNIPKSRRGNTNI